MCWTILKMRKERSTKEGICYKIYGRVDKINDLSDMQIAEMKKNIKFSKWSTCFFMPPREWMNNENDKIEWERTLKSNVKNMNCKQTYENQSNFYVYRRMCTRHSKLLTTNNNNNSNRLWNCFNDVQWLYFVFNFIDIFISSFFSFFFFFNRYISIQIQMI
jgi:hypothetical protein